MISAEDIFCFIFMQRDVIVMDISLSFYSSALHKYIF